MIKPHECWQNTFFWEEYFYGTLHLSTHFYIYIICYLHILNLWFPFFIAQSTSKFQELFGDLSPEGSVEMERVFFEDELIQFGPSMAFSPHKFSCRCLLIW